MVNEATVSMSLIFLTTVQMLCAATAKELQLKELLEESSAILSNKYREFHRQLTQNCVSITVYEVLAGFFLS